MKRKLSESEEQTTSKKFQWLWNCNPNSWQRYADTEMDKIEHAYQNGANQVELDNSIIDFQKGLQISKMDPTKQGPIKRQPENILKCIRGERFILPNGDTSDTPGKTFGDESTYTTPNFVVEWIKRNQGISFADRIDKTIEGILEEGRLAGQVPKSELFAQRISDVKTKSFDEIGECCLDLYTKSSFLYETLNKALREEDLSKVDTLGPFCDFLWNSLSSESLRAKYRYTGYVYRGAQLTPDQIQMYKSSIQKSPKAWLGFSSTSKDRLVAECFGNTLFCINVPSPRVDLSTISSYKEEQEVLLGASTGFQIEDVTFDEGSEKHHIHVRILW